MASCSFCRLDCCGCSGCQMMKTSTGIECCSKCYSMAEKSVQQVQNYQNNMSTQQLLIKSVEDILRKRGLTP